MWFTEGWQQGRCCVTDRGHGVHSLRETGYECLWLKMKDKEDISGSGLLLILMLIKSWERKGDPFYEQITGSQESP